MTLRRNLLQQEASNMHMSLLLEAEKEAKKADTAKTANQNATNAKAKDAKQKNKKADKAKAADQNATNAQAKKAEKEAKKADMTKTAN